MIRLLLILPLIFLSCIRNYYPSDENIDKNTSYLHMEIEELGRTSDDKGIMGVHYRLKPDLFPEGEEFDLFAATLKGEAFIDTFIARPDGALYSKKGLNVSFNIFASYGYILGEPIRYILASKNKKFAAQTLFVPFPLEAKGNNEATVSLIVGDTLCRSFACCGEQFEPNEKLAIRTIIDGQEIEQSEFEQTRDGFYFFFSVPWNLLKHSGKGVVEVQRENETISLEFNWGKEALKVVRAKDSDIPSEKSYSVFLNTLHKQIKELSEKPKIDIIL